MNSSSVWCQGLNEEQIQAVLHTHGPLLILAGAGSGKTTVLVARTGRLIAEGHVRPENMCVLTFTNKAARELKHRVSARLGAPAQKVWAGTFHSFGLHFLRRHHHKAHLQKHFGVIDPSDATALVKELLQDFRYASKTAYKCEALVSKISRWREEGRTGAETDDPYDAATEWLLPKYLKRLETLGVLDFDSLILKPIELLKADESVRRETQEHFQQVMVDEFQDTSLMQMKLIDLLVGAQCNLAVVGDDDQSIYGWRGACMKNILGFPQK